MLNVFTYTYTPTATKVDLSNKTNVEKATALAIAISNSLSGVMVCFGDRHAIVVTEDLNSSGGATTGRFTAYDPAATSDSAGGGTGWPNSSTSSYSYSNITHLWYLS